MVTIGSTAVGLGVDCEQQVCDWDSARLMQNNYTSRHRQLMLDCLGVDDSEARPSQAATNVTIAQRMFARGRSFMNIVEMQNAIQQTGATVRVVSFEGRQAKDRVAKSLDQDGLTTNAFISLLSMWQTKQALRLTLLKH